MQSLFSLHSMHILLLARPMPAYLSFLVASLAFAPVYCVRVFSWCVSFFLTKHSPVSFSLSVPPALALTSCSTLQSPYIILWSCLHILVPAPPHPSPHRFMLSQSTGGYGSPFLRNPTRTDVRTSRAHCAASILRGTPRLWTGLLPGTG